LPKQTVVLLFICLSFISLTAASPNEDRPIRLLHVRPGNSAELLIDGKHITLRTGETAGTWTLVETVPSSTSRQSSRDYVILEDYSQLNGHLFFINSTGVQLDLSKSSETTSANPAHLYLGHTPQEILQSPQDLLATQILAKDGDPDYNEIAAAFEPIRKIQTYSFVGATETADKVGFAYGGRSPNFDPAVYVPEIDRIRDQGKVLDGLVGGYLPILRFVYPETNENWTELLAFAPLRMSNANTRVQPVWYRVTRVVAARFQWAKYIDSYHPFPPRTDYDPKLFYKDLQALQAGWQAMLHPGMQIDLPDEHIANMSRFALIRDRMTRVADFPKYGAVDKDYAGSEHDGFPDTFNVDTTAMLEWGLTDLAARYIDNYFGNFVRDDGSILYRGPETGQYGRMLTVVAQFVNFGGDPHLLLKHRSRIDGVTNLLLTLRAKAKKLPPTDPAFGMIAGWSEADACLDPQPDRYMQPYFSNSTEAARGFRDLGRVWQKIGQRQNDSALVAWGRRLQREAAELRVDIQQSIQRSILTLDGEKILPSIAGVKEPFHIVVPRDNTDPQYRSYRAYMEMLYSGSLSKDEVHTITTYRSNHHDTILGVPTAYGYDTSDLAGFLAYGHGYGLIQHDMIREALLLTYSVMAHQYTRGTWTAPETRNVLRAENAAPYCTPAQLVVALLTRWMLVFEDPESETLWLGKAIPRAWLADGKTTSISSAPTRWGRVGFSISSQINAGKIIASVALPSTAAPLTKLRLRTPTGVKIHSVLLNGKPWSQFDADEETVSIPPLSSRPVKIEARYN